MPIEKHIIETPLTDEELVKWMKQCEENLEKDIQLEKESEERAHAELRGRMGEKTYQKYLKEEAEREKEAKRDFEKSCMEWTKHQEKKRQSEELKKKSKKRKQSNIL
jgi:hypothetical protein